MHRSLLLAAFALVLGGHAAAAAVTEADLMKAAVSLSAQYDANYAAKKPEAMASLYASDGVLVSPAGPLVHGRDALKAYYVARFASGARDHAIEVVEVHVQGDGGYGISRFHVTVPDKAGVPREEHGSIVAVYRRDPDGWHMRLVEPSVPPTK